MPEKPVKKAIRSQQGKKTGNSYSKCLQSPEKAIRCQQGDNMGSNRNTFG